MIFEDANDNGVRDPGEPAMTGVLVILYDVAGIEIARTTTGPDGSYLFSGLADGDYELELRPSAGWEPGPRSSADQGSEFADNRRTSVTLDGSGVPIVAFGGLVAAQAPATTSTTTTTTSQTSPTSEVSSTPTTRPSTSTTSSTVPTTRTTTGTIPFTGAESGRMTLIALILLATGVGMVLITRRERTGPESR